MGTNPLLQIMGFTDECTPLCNPPAKGHHCLQREASVGNQKKIDFVYCANPKAMENEQDRPYNSFTYNQMQTSGKPQEIGIHHWASKSKIKGCIVMNALKWKASARSQKKNLLHLPRYSLSEKIWTRRQKTCHLENIQRKEV